jgi:hypothetical protein
LGKFPGANPQKLRDVFFMNLRRFPILVVLFVLLFPTLYITLTGTISKAGDYFRSNLSFADEAVPLNQEDVYESLDQELLLLSEAKARVWLTLRRSPRYLPLIEKALSDASVPQDFKYLPMALTNLEPAFRSGQRRGIWRLSDSEASSLGLTVNRQVDQRLDPGASSIAVAGYLARLHKSYGTWTLALAAFLDEPSLARAMQESGGEKSLYLLYLPDTLEKAVSQVLAGKILYSSPGVYGYNLSKPWPVLARSQARLDEGSAMLALAARYKVDYKTFRDMNPHILTDSAPAGAVVYIP